MFTGLYTSAAGMLAQIRNMEIISNNLANINSAGFKKDKALFRTFYDDAINSVSSPLTSSGTSLLNKDSNSMVVIDRASTDFSEGLIKETGNPLDIAIQGDGFFALQDSNGKVYYSRGGNFRLNETGEIVNADGFKLMGELGAIIVESGSGAVETKGISIDETGTVRVNEDDVGKIRLVRFIDGTQLEKIGHNSFANKDDKNFSGAAFDGKIQQEHLEMSNVNPIAEMTEMITTTRAFEAYQKVVQAVMDDTTEKVINIVGRKR